ncbi:MAG: ABC transporter permease [Bacteroidetes bacterium]|nr:ABC transporter permease [Bacteroidota bacterium]
MNILNLLKVAINSLTKNKFRSFLTMLGIIIGVASVIAMMAIGQGSKQSIEEQISTLGTNLLFIRPATQTRGGVKMGAGSAKFLTVADANAIKRESEFVSAVSPMVRGGGQAVSIYDNWPTNIYGVDIDYFSIKNWELKDGRLFTNKEIKSSQKLCLLGNTVVEKLFGEAYNPIGESIRYNKIPFKIIGILKAKGESNFGQDQDDIIIAPYTTVQKRILAITHVHSIYVSATSSDVSQKASIEIEELLRRRHKILPSDESDFKIRTQEEIMTRLTSTSDILTALLSAIAGISLLVGGIGIMNIMYVSVTERTREIGLRMAVGGKGLDILLQFLIESTLLSVIGGIIGILLGIGVSKFVSNFMSWPVHITMDSIILSFIFCTVIGIFFGWYPARKAASLNPIDALRYE